MQAICSHSGDHREPGLPNRFSHQDSFHVMLSFEISVNLLFKGHTKDRLLCDPKTYCVYLYQGQQTMALRPNESCHLVLYISFWNTALYIYLHIAHGCFNAAVAELSIM